jgi:putative addiction module component (TIGR02574 family)
MMSMSPRLQRVLDEALHLTEQERADLAASLIGSLDQRYDEDSQQVWDAEVRKRVEELDSGKIQAVPWSEVRRRLMRRLDDKSAA